MTEEQLDRLPPILREIVVLHRRLDAEKGGNVHTFELHHRRRRIAADLRGAWGRPHNDDTPRPPVAQAG